MAIIVRDVKFSLWQLSGESNCYRLKRKRCGMRTLLLCTADNVPRTYKMWLEQRSRPTRYVRALSVEFNEKSEHI